MTEHGHRFRLVRIGDDLTALFENLVRVLGEQTDQLLATFLDQVRTLQAANTDEVGLLLGDGPAIAGIVRRPVCRPCPGRR